MSEDEQVTDLQRRSARLSDTARLVLAVVLACALVVAVGAGIALAVRTDDTRSALNVNASMEQELKARAEAQSAAEAFVVNMNTYSKDDISEYDARVAPLVTPKQLEAFRLTLDSIKQLVTSTKMTSEGTVLKTAVSHIDPESAVTLVVADAQVSSLLGERQRHFRWKVILVKQDNRWLVDDWQVVA